MTASTEDAQWVRAIVDTVDRVGWRTGVRRDHNGNMCLLGAALTVNGHPTEVLMDTFKEMVEEDEAAERLAIALEIDDNGAAWAAIVEYNDTSDSWELLKADILRRIGGPGDG